MIKNKSYKFRLEPNKEQACQINRNIGCSRKMYNLKLEEKLNNSRRKTEKEYKEKYSFLKEVDSVALQQARRDFQQACKNYYNRKKKGEKTSLKFKSKRDPKNSYRTQNINNSIKINGNRIKLPKVGWVKFRKSREVKGTIKNITVTRDILGIYRISILTEQEIPHKPKSDNEVGIDLGIKDFAIDSNGEKYFNPQYLRKYEYQLKKEQRKLSRKKHGSSNYFKQRQRLFKVHEKIRNMREDFLHKLSSKIISDNQVISLEDLSIENMKKNHKLAKSISDASWGKFARMLEYKADWYGRQFVKIDKFFPSSQLCSSCGNKNEGLTLSQRWWTCNMCGIEHDRDENAAKNVLHEGKRILSGRADHSSSSSNETVVSCW